MEAKTIIRIVCHFLGSCVGSGKPMHYLCIEPLWPFRQYRGGQLCSAVQPASAAPWQHFQMRTSKNTVPATTHMSCS